MVVSDTRARRGAQGVDHPAPAAALRVAIGDEVPLDAITRGVGADHPPPPAVADRRVRRGVDEVVGHLHILFITKFLYFSKTSM